MKLTDAERAQVISIHAPTRGATMTNLPLTTNTWNFNPRAHEGRDWVRESTPTGTGNFNPRAHEGRDDTDRFLRAAISISIHAPTRGATAASPMRHPTVEHFNPRAHEGRDAIRLRHGTQFVDFNPRAHEGRDTPPVVGWLLDGTFQSTRPRGARPSRATRPYTAAHFNPRAHEGRDRHSVRRCVHHWLFQSTRPRGARPGRRRLVFRSGLFQSTRPRGARP